MPVYVVAQGRIDNHELLDEYVARAVPTIPLYEGRVVAFDESPVVVEGKIDFPRTVILEFPSRQAFEEWYHSPEYQSVLPMRLESAPGSMILATGDGVPRAG